MSDVVERVIGDLTVRIERSLCVGFAQCVDESELAFQIDDDDDVVVFESPEQETRERFATRLQGLPGGGTRRTRCRRQPAGPVSSGTLAARLADYVCGLSIDDIPDEVVAKAKDDRLPRPGGGCRRQRLDGERACAVVRTRPWRTGWPVPGDRHRRHVRAARRHLGQRRHDAHAAAGGLDPAIVRSHPGPILLPAALAVADEVGASGADLITAVVAGYDILGTLAGGDWSWDVGARTSSHVYGAFGAAVVAARLLGCDREQTVKAICYAGNLGAMITYGFDNHQYGVVARNGVTAAFLGEARCPARTDALEGPYGFYQAQVRRMPTDLGERMDSLGKRFEIMTSILKPHPCTAINLVPTRLLEQLLATHGIAGADVATVVVGRSRQIDLVPMLHAAGPWPSPTEATSSLPFALAAVLLDGTVTAERLNDLNGADIVERSQQIRIDLSDDPDLLRHTVEVRTRSGITVKDSADVGILRPPRLADILSDEAVTAIGRTKSDELFKMVAELETLGL